MKNVRNTRYLTSRLLIIASVFVFTFCGDDDKPSTPQLTYSLDGESQSVQTVTAFLQSQIQYSHEGRALNITAVMGNGEMLSVAVSNWDFQNPPDNGILAGEYDATFDFEDTETENPFANCLTLTGENEGVVLCDGGLVSLISGSDFYTSVFDGDTEASITISKCDAGNRTVSGTFSAKIAGFDGVQQYTISGSFDNVKYIVQ